MVTAARLAHPVGVVGAGLLGLAVARQLAQSQVPVVVFEKEAAVARHQSGHNSGVVHAGIYYLPGSAKATMCRRGVELLRAYCADRGLPWDARGKLVVARDEAETAKLREIERRAAANGVPGVRWLDAAAMRELEPEIAGQAALFSPTTAITDYPAIARSYADDVVRSGGQVLTGTPVSGVHRRGADEVEVASPGGTHRLSRLVICAGLQADLLAAAAGGRVRLRTAARTEAMTVLAHAGATVAVIDRDTLIVTGLPAERVVARLGEGGVPFSEVSAHCATLEEAYMELTRDAVEYRAAPAPEATR